MSVDETSASSSVSSVTDQEKLETDFSEDELVALQTVRTALQCFLDAVVCIRKDMERLEKNYLKMADVNMHWESFFVGQKLNKSD